MKEEFLHYLWRYCLLQPPLTTTDGQEVEVVKPGVYNPDSGPDFFDARLKIADTYWAGNVEIHLHSSSWYEHRHDEDDAYNNVILHVVLHHDRAVQRPGRQTIPALECHDRIPEHLYNRYADLMRSRLWIPCARIIVFCPELIIKSTIEQQLIERMMARSKQIETILKATGNDWEETFYRLLARSFGLKINTLPFEMLAASLPYKLIVRHIDQPLQVDALLLGQAGFLEKDHTDDYPKALRNEYLFLKNKYSLQPMNESVWKFMRLRPAAFPTIRIAQFSSLLQKSSSMLSTVLEAAGLHFLTELFNVKAGSYWDDHYLTDKKVSGKKVKTLGEESIERIIINAVAPMLFYYGMSHGLDEFKYRALSLLEQLPPENNTIVKRWRSVGLDVEDAFTTQALIHLKQSLCDHKKCLHCRIGRELLK